MEIYYWRKTRKTQYTQSKNQNKYSTIEIGHNNNNNNKNLNLALPNRSKHQTVKIMEKQSCHPNKYLFILQRKRDNICAMYANQVHGSYL